MTTDTEIKQKQNNLEKLVETYLRGAKELLEVKKVKDGLVAPEYPTAVDSLKALQEHQQLEAGYLNKKASLEVRCNFLQKEIKRLEHDIIILIPVEKVWIKVGDKAVSTYTDVWGGDHTELEILDWSENLPEQKDKRNYP